MTYEEYLEMPRAKKAMDNFLSGYNCAQSVTLAFSDLVSEYIDADTLSKMSCSFGGGVSRLREICGAISGSAMIMSLLYGYSTNETGDLKKEQYARVQEIAERFEEMNPVNSVVCRTLLGLDVNHDTPNASPRTAEYYKERPCGKIIGLAAGILEEYIAEHPVK